MKNLKKINRNELKSIAGGIAGCYHLADGSLYCPCLRGYKKCNGVCIPENQICK